MTDWLTVTVVVLVTGCIYALISTGLVVTYTTTGIFNFAHGAIGMIAAFTFWQLWQGWHINAVVSLLLVLVVIAPLFGVVIERVLMRPLSGASVDMTVVVPLGLLLAIAGAVAIGLGQNYIIEFAGSSGGFLSRIYNVLPMFVLFAALFLLPQDRLRTASFAGVVAPRVASLKSSIVAGVMVVAAAA